ncbi:MAG: sigma 54-interacting transcriptional regulator [Myxococcota bacterium]|nr:sigma 54-interacting transcriptional regulator [Myxococcota bacterium]
MEAIVLLYRNEALRTFELGTNGLEVGSGSGCDVVVHDPDVVERHYLIRLEDGNVVALDLRSEARRQRPIPLRPGEELWLSRRHAIMRIPDAPTRPHTSLSRTEPIPVHSGDGTTMSLLIGRGADARRVTIGGRPMLLGSDRACDVVLHDRAVSGRHCRIEPGPEGVLVRDLASRNGTFVDGVRSFSARIGPGTRLRVGRTDLLVVARGESGDARSDGLIASSPAMLDVLGLVERYAQLSFPALVLGESGAGKEGIARALHARGPRRDKPFVAVNAGGLPRDLIESELFGHEKGAFTGALAQRRGVFEQADGGTLFLDEIGELPLPLQARLLRVLDSGEIRRVGSEQSIRVDVRLVCATHRDVRAMVDEGTFRRDLYYRLGQLFVEVPALRDRPEDVRTLAQHFLSAIAVDVGPRELSSTAIERLIVHDWPGNARELRNVIHAAAASSAGIVDAADIEAAIRRIDGPRATRTSDTLSLLQIVARCDGNLTQASRATGIPRSTLRGRLKTEAERLAGKETG